MLKTAAWFVALGLGSLVLSAAQVLVLDWAGARAKPRPSSSAPRPRSLFEPTTVLDPLGHFPSSRLAYDASVQGRLYAGGERSDDGGRTWQPLTGDHGTRIVLLGAGKALAPAVGPGGRVLFAEVLFDEPGVDFGLGLIAHAVEWRAGRWTQLVSAAEGPLPSDAPNELLRFQVRSVAYLPDGRTVVAMRDRVLIDRENSIQGPIGLQKLLVTTKGALYAAVQEPGRFNLYFADGAGSPWLPVSGMGAVQGFAEGSDGDVLVASGRRLGRGSGTDWQWSALPAELTPEEVSAHPRAPLVAAWGRGDVAVSKDGGRTAVMCRMKDLRVAWAAWDPFASDALTVLDLKGNAYRVKLDSVR